MLKEKIGVIGAGKIGSAIMRGILQAGLVGKDQVFASDAYEGVGRALSQELGIKVSSNNGEVVDFADILVLAVKPQVLNSMLDEIAESINDKKLMV
jgi:pyrroline-5-carboxylate reductase